MKKDIEKIEQAKKRTDDEGLRKALDNKERILKNDKIVKK